VNRRNGSKSPVSHKKEGGTGEERLSEQRVNIRSASVDAIVVLGAVIVIGVSIKVDVGIQRDHQPVTIGELAFIG